MAQPRDEKDGWQMNMASTEHDSHAQSYGYEGDQKETEGRVSFNFSEIASIIGYSNIVSFFNSL